jgi:hypothetical protein
MKDMAPGGGIDCRLRAREAVAKRHGGGRIRSIDRRPHIARLEGSHRDRNRNRSGIFALSYFRTEGRIPPIAREDGRKRPDAPAETGIFLKMP